MKRFFVLFLILFSLISWIHTEAEAQTDTTKPMVTFPDVPTGRQSSNFTIMITFDETVYGFLDSEIELTPTGLATVSLSGSGMTYTATIEPTAGQDGTLTITVPAGVAIDASSNGNTAASTTVDIDTKPPTVTITPPSGTQTAAFNVTFAFSEAVTGFTSGDIIPTAGARVSSFTGSNGDTTYTATITPKTTSTVTISVAAAVATDTVGNDNEAASITVGVDLPHAIMVMEPEDGVGPYSEAFTVMIMFTESVDSFTDSDITLSPSSLATVTDVTGNAPTYTATITPTDGETGNLDIKVANAAVQDGSSMNYPASNTVTVKVDTERPTVAIDAPTSDPQNSAFDITITFSENVNSFDPDDDITLGGSASATPSLKSGSDGDGEYTVTITPSSSGNLTIEVDGDAAEDDAGNKSAMSDAASVTIDQDAPTVTISTNAPNTPKKDPFIVTITFSEDVDGFDTNSIALSPSGLATVAGVPGSGDSYTATITPAGMGDITIQVEAGEVKDTAGNDNEASNTVTIAIDSVKPTVTLDAPSDPKNGEFDVPIAFSEDVMGFVVGDILLGGTATYTQSLMGMDDEYTLTITPTGSGTVTIQVPANKAKDAAENGNEASSSEIVNVDVDAPTVMFSGVPTTKRNRNFTITIRFNEDVTGFVEGDITLTPTGLATVSNFTGDDGDTVYTATIAPIDEQAGTLTITVPAGAATDGVSNGNEAASAIVEVDRVRPMSTISGEPPSTVNDAFDITVTFSESMRSFVPTHLEFGGDASGSVTHSVVNADKTVYTLTITPGNDQDGEMTIQVEDGRARGEDGNVVRESNTVTIDVDTRDPTVLITGVPTGRQKNNFPITITFSENVTGFVKGDIELSPTTLATVSSFSGSGMTYTAMIAPTAGQEGTLTITVPANAAVDDATNENTAASTTVEVDKLGPTSTISGAPSGTVNAAFDITVTFSDSVRSFVPNHFDFGGDATGSVTASVVDADNKVFMVTITPDSDQDGVMTIQVPSGRVPDTLGNRASASNTVTIDVDTIKPTVTFLGVPTNKRNRDFTITITFDETVYGFLDSEIILTPTGLATVSNFTGDDGDTVYTATIAPIDEQDGTLTITVPAGAATDGASNGNEAASTTAVEVDRVRPTSTISGEPPSTVNGAFIITVTFSESMRSFVPTHLEFGGDASGSVTNSVVNANKTVYTLTITPSNDQDGEMTIQVEDGRARGADGNVVRESNTVTIDVDTIVPTATISDLPAGEENDAFNLTITFNEDVSGFATGDLTVTGQATATVVSGGPQVYTATITPNDNQEDDVMVTVKANAVTDAAGNSNPASATTSNIHIDTIVPTVSISGLPTGEQKEAFPLTITFNEDVSGFATGDLTVTGQATATVSGGPKVYTATITPNANQEDDVTVTVKANAVTDAAGNSNPVSATTSNIHIDTIVPTVSISGVPTGEQKEAFPLTITFLEDVSGFATEDLTVPGQATATVVSGGPQVYTATITPTANQEDDVTVTVKANAVTDAAGNNNTVSATTSAIHIDTIAPTATISGLPSGEQKDAFPLTITFNENVTGFAAGDLMVTGQATATVVPVGPKVYTATITPTANQEGNVTVRVRANTVTDDAGNGNTVSATTSAIHIDTIAPTATISGLPSGEENDAFNLTITFLEDVSGFATGDLTVTGQATATAVSVGPRVYTATITPNANQEGDVTVRVRANTVTDAAGNSNPASATTSNIHIDTIRPTVRFEDVPVLEKRNDIFDIKVVFSEPVNGFQVPADMTIDGPVTASLTSGSDGAAEYTVTITPNPTSKGDLTFRVNPNAVQDLALNNNTASEVTDAVRIDTVPPIAEITNLPTVAGAPFDVTITFNEEVTGFASADIALTGPATATLKSGVDGDTIYTATITPNPNAKGDVRILIPAGVVKDFALNDNIPSEITPPIHVGTNALTVQITDVPETVQLEDFSVMIKFSMDVADFVLADITISGDAAIQTSSLSGRGSVYLLKITPEADTDGAVTIQVPAGVATDAASNSNTASVLQTVSVAPKWMPEAGLRDATREVLGLDAGEDFERAELKRLTTLTAESRDIRVLTGLEAATNLTALDLSGNAITDIALLRGLTKLTTLDLGANAITDITTLAQLTELTTLDLSGNAITDITLLQGLTKLTTLDLGANAITDIAVLAGLTKLTTLNLSDNPISNLNPLLALTSLTTLGLSGNAINDLTVISDLTGLFVLNLSDNAIADITLLQNLTALTTLDLSGNTVSNLMTLAGLTQLRTLRLNNNTVSDLTALGGLANLTTLALAGNAISTLNPIATLRQLTLLDLRDNNISDVSTLASLANLTTLRLMGNPILDTTPLYPLTQRLPPVDIDIAVLQYTPWDVNADGSVDAADSALVTVALGQIGAGIVNPRTDVNGDGSVNNADLLLVTENFDNVPGAPAVADILRLLDPATLASLNREVLATELQILVLESDGSLKYQRAIELLQRLLAVQRPDQTRLFANYPNPFNPETWIPYQLAVGSKVVLVIYDVKGVVVRHLELGHQPAGYYTQKNRAAYWDGRNAVGERVASGIYFYQLRADNVSLLRKMVILK